MFNILKNLRKAKTDIVMLSTANKDLIATNKLLKEQLYNMQLDLSNLESKVKEYRHELVKLYEDNSKMLGVENSYINGLLKSIQLLNKIGGGLL